MTIPFMGPTNISLGILNATDGAINAVHAQSRGAWRRRARRVRTARPSVGTVVAPTSRRPMPAREGGGRGGREGDSGGGGNRG